MKKILYLLLMLGVGTSSLLCVRGENQDLSEPEKNFEHLWKDFDQNYGIFGPKRVNWDLLYKVYRPKVTPQTTDDELFTIMSGMLKQLNDNHVRLRKEGKQFTSGLLGEIKMRDHSLLLIREKYLKGNYDTLHKNIFHYGWLDDSIGYFHFRGFSSPSDSADAIDEIVDEFKDAKGIIIDVRQNGGGDDRVGKIIAGRFAKEKKMYMITRIRNGPSHDDFTEPKLWYVEPDGPIQFTKPVILLTHRHSVSAAENFALAMRVIPHATLVGDFTSGCFADMRGETLPNGWRYSISYTLFTDQNGFCWEGIGVPPDLRITNTAEDIAKKNDRVLEFAMELIHSREID